MRNLAQDLHVVPMALYRHVANKDELLDGMIDLVVDEIDPPETGVDWKTAIRRRILSARRALLRHPWASRVIDSRPEPTATVLAYMDSMMGMIRAGGFSIDLVHHALHTMGSRLMGFSQELFNDTAEVDPTVEADMWRTLADRYPNIAELVGVVMHDDTSVVGGGCDDQFEFEFALDLIMTGRPYFMRLVGFGFLRPKKNPIPGREVAGIVEKVGAKVTRFRPGDEVMGVCDGAFAEYVATPSDWLVSKPVNLSFEQAAVVAISGVSALQALRDKGQVQPKQKVLIIGAGGGVGTFAVQIAKAFGAEVTGVCSTNKVDLVRSIGADHVIDYTRTDFTREAERYDLIIDSAGRRSLRSLRRVLTPTGTLVIVGGEGGGRWMGGFLRGMLRAPLLSLFVGQRLVGLVSKETQEDLQTVRDMLEAGQVTPVIDRIYPLIEAPAAIQAWAAGHARGKSVITV